MNKTHVSVNWRHMHRVFVFVEQYTRKMKLMYYAKRCCMMLRLTGTQNTVRQFYKPNNCFGLALQTKGCGVRSQSLNSNLTKDALYFTD